jgi:hypothetical protein
MGALRDRCDTLIPLPASVANRAVSHYTTRGNFIGGFKYGHLALLLSSQAVKSFLQLKKYPVVGRRKQSLS